MRHTGWRYRSGSPRHSTFLYRSASGFWEYQESTAGYKDSPCIGVKTVIRKTRKTVGRSGFSLLELLAVVTILGVIAAVVVPRISASKTGAQEEVNKQNIAEINRAVERYFFDKGTWPKNNLNDIGADPDYFPDGIPRNPIDNSRYQLNKDTHRVEEA